MTGLVTLPPCSYLFLLVWRSTSAKHGTTTEYDKAASLPFHATLPICLRILYSLPFVCTVTIQNPLNYTYTSQQTPLIQPLQCMPRWQASAFAACFLPRRLYCADVSVKQDGLSWKHFLNFPFLHTQLPTYLFGEGKAEMQTLQRRRTAAADKFAEKRMTSLTSE